MVARGDQPRRHADRTCRFSIRRAVTPPARPSILQRILPNGDWGYGRTDRAGHPIRFIVNHVAVGNGSLYNWFKGRQLSTHYWVSKLGEIEQYCPDTGAAYGQGIIEPGSNFPPEYPGDGPTYNMMALSVEAEGFPTEERTPIQWQRIVELNRWLAFTHHVPVDRDHIVGHYRTDWRNRGHCPSTPTLNAFAYMARLLADISA